METKPLEKHVHPAQALVAKLNSPDTLNKLRAVQTKYLTADRMLRLLSSCMAGNPKLMNCTFVSILNSVISATKLGIEIDGRHAHLIPYKDEAKLIIDWKGYVLLGRRNNVSGINAQVVYSQDEFDIVHTEAGTKLVHRPNLKDGRGEPIGVYCSYTIDEAPSVEWMTIDEVELIRRRSKSADEGPWVTDYLEMARKTVVRRASKYWPFADVDIGALSTADFDSPAIEVETATTSAEPPPGQVGTTLVGAERRAELAPAQPAEQPVTRRRRIRAEEVPAAATPPPSGTVAFPPPAPAPAPATPPPAPAAPGVEGEMKIMPACQVLLDNLTAAGYTFDDLLRAQGNGLIVRGMDLSQIGDIYDLPENWAVTLNQCRVAVMRGIAEHRNALL